MYLLRQKILRRKRRTSGKKAAVSGERGKRAVDFMAFFFGGSIADVTNYHEFYDLCLSYKGNSRHFMTQSPNSAHQGNGKKNLRQKVKQIVHFRWFAAGKRSQLHAIECLNLMKTQLPYFINRSKNLLKVLKFFVLQN